MFPTKSIWTNFYNCLRFLTINLTASIVLINKKKIKNFNKIIGKIIKMTIRILKLTLIILKIKMSALKVRILKL
jgi:hypothetical protein